MAVNFNPTSAQTSYYTKTWSTAPTHPLTISFWFKPDTALGASGDMMFQTTKANANKLIYIHRANVTNLLTAGFSNASVASSRGHQTASPNTIWAHIVGRWSGTTGIQIWHNGIISSNAQSGPNPSVEPMTRLDFGARATLGTLQQANGVMAHLALWKLALTDRQCTNLYRINPLMMRPLPTYYWPLWNLDPVTDMINKLSLNRGGTAPPTVDDSIPVARGPTGLI